MTTITAAVWLLFIPIAVLIGIALWLSEDRPQRARRLRRQGWTWQQVAAHLGTSPTTARRWAAA